MCVVQDQVCKIFINQTVSSRSDSRILMYEKVGGTLIGGDIVSSSLPSNFCCFFLCDRLKQDEITSDSFTFWDMIKDSQNKDQGSSSQHDV